MAVFTDQTIAGNFDPAFFPGGTQPVTITTMTIDDRDDDGFIRSFSGDRINGNLVTRVYDGDTVTLDGTVITGVTFYTVNGGRYFTPSDGSVLSDGDVTDTSFVFASTQFPVSGFTPPCFVAGTRIAVPGGTAAVETLGIGDLVVTRDNGPRPIRWIGQRTVPGAGAFAPIRIAAGALGDHGTLRVSPQHRILLGGWRAQVYLGEDEVLCPAHMLVDDARIRRAPCATVTYVHFMFDRHEIVTGEGLDSESFFLGDYLCSETSALRAEILAVFPELDAATLGMRAARRVTRAHEAALLTPARHV